MKLAVRGSEGVYIIRRGGSGKCFANPAPKMTQKSRFWVRFGWRSDETRRRWIRRRICNTPRMLRRVFRRYAPNMTQNQVNKDFMRLRPRCISIGQLNGRYPLTPPTYQTGSLPDTLLASAMGYLILRPASRLDAFSGYPIRTWLPGLCSWRNNRFTSGPSIPVLSY